MFNSNNILNNNNNNYNTINKIPSINNNLWGTSGSLLNQLPSSTQQSLINNYNKYPSSSYNYNLPLNTGILGTNSFGSYKFAPASSNVFLTPGSTLKVNQPSTVDIKQINNNLSKNLNTIQDNVYNTWKK